MAAVEWRDVRHNDGLVVMRDETTKNGEPHVIPIAGEFAEVMERVQAL